MAIRFFNPEEVIAQNRVVETFEKNYYDDSDFYAIILNDDLTGHDIVEYDTTRCGSFGCADIDITPENFNKYWENAGKQRYINWCKDQDHRDNLIIRKGAMVEVKAGKKVPHGIKGEVFWIKSCSFGIGYRAKECQRIGIRDEDDNVYWTYDYNVERIDLDEIEYVQERETIERVNNFSYEEKLRAFITSVRCLGSFFF